jgi:hypothetical protein
MSGANSFKFVLLPPQSDTTRDWAKRLAKIVSEARVLVIGGGSVRQTPLISLYATRFNDPDQRSSQRLGPRTVTHEGGQTKLIFLQPPRHTALEMC